MLQTKFYMITFISVVLIFEIRVDLTFWDLSWSDFLRCSHKILKEMGSTNGWCQSEGYLPHMIDWKPKGYRKLSDLSKSCVVTNVQAETQPRPDWPQLSPTLCASPVLECSPYSLYLWTCTSPVCLCVWDCLLFNPICMLISIYPSEFNTGTISPLRLSRIPSSVLFYQNGVAVFPLYF